MTYSEKFNYLKETYGKSADTTKLKCNFAAQITMTDDDCHGIFYIAYMNGELAIEPYDYHDNTVAITVNSKLLEGILNGTANPIDAFKTGELKAEGDLGHALMMISALKAKPEEKADKQPEPAAKKTCKKTK